ncbi:MAG: hypothetical protein WCF23_20505, partial [Candidatus Nitrosopolaris sp.]
MNYDGQANNRGHAGDTDVLYWSEVVGIPFIEADTKNKLVYVKDWPNIDFSKVNFRENVEKGVYDNGIALVLGRTLSGKLYS